VTHTALPLCLTPVPGCWHHPSTAQIVNLGGRALHTPTGRCKYSLKGPFGPQVVKPYIQSLFVLKAGAALPSHRHSTISAYRRTGQLRVNNSVSAGRTFDEPCRGGHNNLVI
jgi:hypothetical protein